MDITYFTSERFIHDDLVQRCSWIVEDLPAFYVMESGKVDSYIVSWPAVAFRNDEGKRTDNPVYLTLPTDRTKWAELTRDLVSRTKAFALFMVDVTRTEVACVFESHLGTRAWTFQVQRRGDIKTLSGPISEVNKKKVGLLWAGGEAN